MTKKLFIVVNVDWFFLSHRKDIALAAQQAGYQVTIVTADTGKLKDIEKKLSAHGFFRLSNSHLVNLRFVEGVEEDAAVVKGDMLFISRRRKKEFLETLNNYMKEGGA